MGMFGNYGGSFDQGLVGGRPASIMSTGGGGGGGFDINNLINSYQGASHQANQAGMAQYSNLMSTVKNMQNSVLGKGGLYAQAGNLLKNQGQSALSNINMQRQQGLAGAQNDLMSRGLGNSTVVNSVQGGVNRDAQRASQSVREGVAGQRAGLLTQQAGAAQNIGGMMGDAILSKNNQSPDLQMYMSLIQQLAANGGAGGGFSGGGPSLMPGSSAAMQNPQMNLSFR